MAIGRSSLLITSIQGPLSVALQYLNAGQQIDPSLLAERSVHFPLPQYACDVNLGPIGVIRLEKAHVLELLTKGGTLSGIERSWLCDRSLFLLALSEFSKEVGIMCSVPADSLLGTDGRRHGRVRRCSGRARDVAVIGGGSDVRKEVGWGLREGERSGWLLMPACCAHRPR